MRKENRFVLEEQDKGEGDKHGPKLNRRERRKVRGREKRRSDKALKNNYDPSRYDSVSAKTIPLFFDMFLIVF